MNDYFDQAVTVARSIPRILENRGLDPIFSRFVLTESDGRAWLFAILDKNRIPKMERYTSQETLHQISTGLNGRPVILSNTTGLRYAVLLSPAPKLPAEVPWPGWRAGLVQLGESKRGPIAIDWDQFGHAIIAGMTQAGKSNALRLIALQAIKEGHKLVIIDPDASTFPEMSTHPQVVFQARSPEAATQAIEQAAQIHRERISTGQTSPRILVLIDEYSGLVMAGGGSRGQFARQVISLAYGSLKFGIHLVLAGHEFTRDQVGPVAGQMITRLCFAVKAPSTSRVVVGRPGAEKVRIKGRALTDPWGWVQVYKLERESFWESVKEDSGPGLRPEEVRIAQAIHQADGRMTHEILKDFGLTRGQRDRLRAEWERRGLVVHDPTEYNSLILADSIIAYIGSLESDQAAGLPGLQGPQAPQARQESPAGWEV